MSEPIDTSDEACAVVCMIVSNPQGKFQSPGWQKRVNDLIRALRDERNSLTAENKAMREATIEECARAECDQCRKGVPLVTPKGEGILMHKRSDPSGWDGYLYSGCSARRIRALALDTTKTT